MSKRTPGPWNIEQGAYTIRIVSEGSLGGPELAVLPYTEQGEANAELMAAAPDLLDACKLALSSCDPHAHFYKVIAAAIAKAEGK